MKFYKNKIIYMNNGDDVIYIMNNYNKYVLLNYNFLIINKIK